MGVVMKPAESAAKSPSVERRRLAEHQLERIFKEAGWKVASEPHRGGQHRADLLVRRRGVEYAVEVKAASDGRSDRLIPLFSQAVLQSLRAAGKSALPLAVVAAPRIAMRIAEHVVEFAAKYAPDVAFGVIDFEGLRVFQGPQLDELNAQPPDLPSAVNPASRREPRHLFSDLNQWMLKVLLAPELPDHLLSAPRGQYRNASQLARVAQVSVMSAFRLVQQLQDEGYLHESTRHLNLVRRRDLFVRWQAAADRPVREVPMRFRLPGDANTQLRKVLYSGRTCLALFAAANALKLGFVEGVPPYLYVERVQPSSLAAWKNLRPCDVGEAPDLILRKAGAPQSVFRGVVRSDGMAASDVLQVWLDVASHSARGREQADLIQQRVLDPVINRKS